MGHSIINNSPNFLIIGAQKCGTTSLFHYLAQHPDIYMPKKKEIHFFDNKYSLGHEWYLTNFRKNNNINTKLTGEASPYYLFHPLVPERVKKHSSKVKLIVMLRNPVDRAYSHFMHEKRLNFEYLNSFERAIELEYSRIDKEAKELRKGKINQSHAYQHFSYISRGMYFKQISHWLQFFPINKMHFIKSEDFFSNPQKEISSICKFLEISNVIPGNMDAQNTNQYQKITDETRKQVSEFFVEDGEKLKKLIGHSFSWA